MLLLLLLLFFADVAAAAVVVVVVNTREGTVLYASVGYREKAHLARTT